jgi:hypothetical protein
MVVHTFEPVGHVAVVVQAQLIGRLHRPRREQLRDGDGGTKMRRHRQGKLNATSLEIPLAALAKRQLDVTIVLLDDGRPGVGRNSLLLPAASPVSLAEESIKGSPARVRARGCLTGAGGFGIVSKPHVRTCS